MSGRWVRRLGYAAAGVAAFGVAVWVLLRARFGDIDPAGATLGALSLVIGIPAMVLAVRAWRRQETNPADLTRLLAMEWPSRAVRRATPRSPRVDGSSPQHQGDVPLGLGLAPIRETLATLAASPDPETVLVAREIELAVARGVRARDGDTPETLRDLSISLNYVARITEQRGQLDDALTAYTESLAWYQRLVDEFGPPLADPDEAASIMQARDRVAEAIERAQGGRTGEE